MLIERTAVPPLPAAKECLGNIYISSQSVELSLIWYKSGYRNQPPIIIINIIIIILYIFSFFKTKLVNTNYRERARIVINQ